LGQARSGGYCILEGIAATDVDDGDEFIGLGRSIESGYQNGGRDVKD
jgi:hypothetical protein